MEIGSINSVGSRSWVPETNNAGISSEPQINDSVSLNCSNENRATFLSRNDIARMHSQCGVHSAQAANSVSENTGKVNFSLKETLDMIKNADMAASSRLGVNSLFGSAQGMSDTQGIYLK